MTPVSINYLKDKLKKRVTVDRDDDGLSENLLKKKQPNKRQKLVTSDDSVT